MKLTISHAALSDALGVASRAVGRNPNVPAVGYVLFDAAIGDVFQVTGTDLRLRAWHVGTPYTTECGQVALPPKSVADFLDAVRPDDPITIETNDAHKATLRSGRTVRTISGLDPEQFPALQMDETVCEISLPAETFRILIESVAFAALGDDSRPALTGVHLDADNTSLTMTAADGMRLARRSMELLDADDFQANVPAKALSIVASGLKGALGAVHLSLDARGRTLGVRSAVGCWAIQLLADPFPDISRQLAQTPEQTVVVDRDDLLRACRLVSTLTADIIGVDGKTVNRVAKALLEVFPDSLTILAGDAQADNLAKTNIDARVEGVGEGDETLLLALNTGALRDAASVLEGPIAIELCGPNRSVFLRNANGSRVEQVLLIQPLAVSSQSQRS